MTTFPVASDFSTTRGIGKTARITSELIVGKPSGKSTLMHRAVDASSGELLGTSLQFFTLCSVLKTQGFAVLEPTDEETKLRLDALSPRTKTWLHNAVQQCNDSEAGGYCDHPASRAEAVAAGLIQQRGGGRIEIPSVVNGLVYGDAYLAPFAVG